MKVAPLSLLLALLSSSGTQSTVMANDSDGGVAGRKLDSSGAKSGKGGSCDLTDPVTRFQRDTGFAQLAALCADTLGAGMAIGIVGDAGVRAIPLTDASTLVLSAIFTVTAATIVAGDLNGDGALDVSEVTLILINQFPSLCPDEVYALGSAPFFGWYGDTPQILGGFAKRG
jgi:hypothetical protein